jgi:hypothetical protein
MYWENTDEWCNHTDEPLRVSGASTGYCRGWEWVVPKYLYPGMEGYTKLEKEAGSEKSQ